MKQFNIEDHLQEIAAPLAGMDDAYTELVRSYHAVYGDDTRTLQYRQEKRAEVRKKILFLKTDKISDSAAIILSLREEYLTRPTPETAPAEARPGNILLWSAILPHQTVDELRELFLQHGTDTDFLALLKVEFKRRGKDSLPALIGLRHEVENGPKVEGLEDLARLEKALSMLSTQRTMWYSKLQECVENNLQDSYPRSIDKDLDSPPVRDTATHRPAFSLTATA